MTVQIEITHVVCLGHAGTERASRMMEIEVRSEDCTSVIVTLSLDYYGLVLLHANTRPLAVVGINSARLNACLTLRGQVALRGRNFQEHCIS